MTALAFVHDFETTGTPDDDAAEIVEAGRIHVDIAARAVQLESMWSSLCKPRGEIPAVTKAVHHITELDVDDAPTFREIVDEFYEGIGPTDYLVAHNARFERHFSGGGGRPWIDTYKVARIVWPDAPTHSNQGLRYWLDLPVNPLLAFPPHRALPDAYVTAVLFCRLLDFKTVEEMARITEYPALLRVMNFGKHKGMTFEDAPTDYLEWIRDKSELDEDTKFSAHYWLRKRTAAA